MCTDRIRAVNFHEEIKTPDNSAAGGNGTSTLHVYTFHVNTNGHCCVFVLIWIPFSRRDSMSVLKSCRPLQQTYFERFNLKRFLFTFYSYNAHKWFTRSNKHNMNGNNQHTHTHTHTRPKRDFETFPTNSACVWKPSSSHFCMALTILLFKTDLCTKLAPNPLFTKVFQTPAHLFAEDPFKTFI